MWADVDLAEILNRDGARSAIVPTDLNIRKIIFIPAWFAIKRIKIT